MYVVTNKLNAEVAGMLRTIASPLKFEACMSRIVNLYVVQTLIT